MRLFVELSPFRSYLDKLPDGQQLLRELQHILHKDPEIGDLVQGTGGIRKMRLAGKGRGKSGGYRVWYLYLVDAGRIYLMAMYAKNESENLSASQCQDLRKLVEILKKEAKREKK